MPYKDPEVRRAYLKAWRERNVEYRKNTMRKYYEENAEHLKAEAKRYHHANREQQLRRNLAWRERNKERFAAVKRAYFETHREESYACGRRWKERHPAWSRICQQVATARLRSKKLGDDHRSTLTSPDWHEILVMCDFECCKCGATEALTLDHIVSLHHDGPTTAANVQPLCATCNLRKGMRSEDHRPTVACERFGSF